MFCQVVTYHRVTPIFLDYVFPFGIQSYRRDAHGGSFHSESCFPDDQPTYRNDQLGRSGHHLEYCFSLQSVESSSDSHSPWSIRMCAVWHNFDLHKDRQTWIIVKANGIIREAIKSRTSRSPKEFLDEKQSIIQALQLTLTAISDIAKWSTQNWHRYINSLEEQLQKRTRPALGTKVSLPAGSLPPDYADLFTVSRRSTACDMYSSENIAISEPKRGLFNRKAFKRRKMTVSDIPELEKRSDDFVEPEPTQFSFDDLQSLQGLEEKANEVNMIMYSNSEVLRQLRQEYRSLVDPTVCPSDMFQDCQKDIARFERRLCGFEAEFGVLRTRIKTFSSLLQERKALVRIRLFLPVFYAC